MMLSLLQQRRSIRRFRPDPVPAEQVEILLEAALRAPSSRGRNPWEFVVVSEPERLRQLAGAKAHGSAFLADAPLAVVVCADPQRCDVWIEDCAIAAILLQLTASSLGLGSCWVQIRLRPHDGETSAEAYLRALLQIPEHLAVACVIGIGQPDEAPPGHPRSALQFDKLHWQHYGGTREGCNEPG